ncbi:hypothetical protein Rhopal_006562-T1 [Rhodotorula paludigena]|uniref:rRNA biogenesis protein RRP36 n=1 Tax=Rhodotorula paludigena TaxID=86838 RepID=A0AAV5GUC7_9BASI|nr:hypothetical protein Rhopal_006562-T1 [Rhodotorula paludigena]
MPAGILKNRTAPSASRKAAPPPAVPSSGSPDEDDFEDSEEDEWEQERQRAGPSSARALAQDNDEDDDEMYEQEGDEDADGVAAYESDQGEMMDDDDDPEEALGKRAARSSMSRFRINADFLVSLRSELAEIPFTSLLKAQKQLKQGGKNKGKGRAAEQDDDEDEGSGARSGKGKKGGKGAKGRRGRAEIESRSNKHAPTEMSTKKPVSRLRQVVESQSALKARDPRFDALSGSVNPALFKQSYGFLADQQRAELDTMRKTVAAAKRDRKVSQDERDRLEDALRRMENREVTRRNKEREQEAMRQWKKEEKDKQAQGKKAFYLKESERKKLYLKAKFDELSTDKRKLHKAMDKKRKKTAQKEKKAMPNTRPGTGRG